MFSFVTQTIKWQNQLFETCFNPTHTSNFNCTLPVANSMLVVMYEDVDCAAPL